MSYHGTLNRLADDVQTRVLAVFEAWQTGVLTAEQFVQLAAAYVAQGNSRAVALGDLAAAAALSVELGAPQPTTGVNAPDDADRLREGLTTLVAAAVAGDITARLTRFARAEPSAAAQDAWVESFSRYEPVEGWKRQLDAGACELCQAWAADARVYSKKTKMLHHAGCQCTPQPVLRKDKK